MNHLKPLTLLEQEVAARNLWVVHTFLQKNRLPSEDWYDVVIFRYLRTVERWFREPKLWRFEFSSIAWNAMRSAVGNERKKQLRRIQTISLDELIPGMDGMTYADIITEKNLIYTPYLNLREALKDENYL